jgi:propanol-preferring alcohol dehydrogenase
MLATVLPAVGRRLLPGRRPEPEPDPGEVRIRVEAWAVCRTDLHVINGEPPQAV